MRHHIGAVMTAPAERLRALLRGRAGVMILAEKAEKDSQDFLDQAKKAPPPRPFTCGYPRLVPVSRRLGLYLVLERCNGPYGHGGRHISSWKECDVRSAQS